mmetsp:Transcript_519/g.1350  ORF Transcript_519/g.1350 Transcript_519/m.1350 type:complete len:256 (+) Transcript_519:1975-2742(+)
MARPLAAVTVMVSKRSRFTGPCVADLRPSAAGAPAAAPFCPSASAPLGGRVSRRWKRMLVSLRLPSVSFRGPSSSSSISRRTSDKVFGVRSVRMRKMGMAMTMPKARPMEAQWDKSQARRKAVTALKVAALTHSATWQSAVIGIGMSDTSRMQRARPNLSGGWQVKAHEPEMLSWPMMALSTCLYSPMSHNTPAHCATAAPSRKSQSYAEHTIGSPLKPIASPPTWSSHERSIGEQRMDTATALKGSGRSAGVHS